MPELCPQRDAVLADSECLPDRAVNYATIGFMLHDPDLPVAQGK
jgi:hypothetical protein